MTSTHASLADPCDSSDDTLACLAPSRRIVGRFQVEQRVAIAHGTPCLGDVQVYCGVAVDDPGCRVRIKALAKANFDRVACRKATQAEIATLQLVRAHPAFLTLEGIYEDDRAIYFASNDLAHDGFVDASRVVDVALDALPSPKFIRSIARQLAAGLAFLHSHSIVHRDIKLSNVAVRGDTVILADVSRAMHVPDGTLLNDHRGGSLAFQAPEVFTPQSLTVGVDGRALDMWALGVVLHTFATGSLPFHDPNPRVMAEKIRVGIFPSPDSAQRTATLPHDTMRLLRALLTRDPAQRITAERLLTLLDAIDLLSSDLPREDNGGPIRRHHSASRSARALLRANVPLRRASLPSSNDALHNRDQIVPHH